MGRRRATPTAVRRRSCWRRPATRAALRAALAAGADAVYLGMEQLGRAGVRRELRRPRPRDGHRPDAPLRRPRAPHAQHPAQGPTRCEPALEALAGPYEAGLDAVLVADLGLAAARAPALPGSGAARVSTQLNTHSSAQLELLARLGFRRAVLARELSLDEIASLDAHGLELEVFVHGALCYGYSGLCLFSSMVGGRSGNRGRCAQACRMRYSLTQAGGEGGGRVPRRRETVSSPAAGRGATDEGIEGRVLSASDLAAVDVLPRLLAAGVRSFKIEGRMKDPTYVATAVRVYRAALDAAFADPASYAVRPEWRESLDQSFSRGFTTAHLDARHSAVRSGGRGGHRGVLVGRVERVDAARGQVVVRLSRAVEAGDVVSLYTSRGQTDPLRLTHGGERSIVLDVREPAAPKDRLFRLAAASVDEAARDAVSGRSTIRPVVLTARLGGEEGGPARLDLRVHGDGGAAAQIFSARALEPATSAPLDESRARAALGALGGTPYVLDELVVDVAPGLFLPVAELRELRRRAVEALDAARLAGYRRASVATATGASAPAVSGRADAGRAGPAKAPWPRPPAGRTIAPAAPIVLRMALDAALGGVRGGGRPSLPGGRSPAFPPATAGIAAVCLELRVGDDARTVAALVARLREQGLEARCRPPVVLFDDDRDWWRALSAVDWDLVYARHAAHLATAAPVVLEYPLQGLSAGNVAALSARGAAVAGAVASPELSLDEVAALAAGLRRGPAEAALEVLAFGRQELLLARDRLGEAEGLVAAATGAEHARLLLEDVKGYRFPALVDARGTVIGNARVTNLARHRAALLAAGVRAFIVDAEAMDGAEAAAFSAGGLEALADFDDRQRHTTGHLFRGVQ